VLELKTLRDLIAHPKTEELSGSVQTQGNEVPFPLAVFTLSKMVTAEACAVAIRDVEEFLDSIHTAAQPQVEDIWFGPRALRGPAFHVGSSRQIPQTRTG
jgi:hypothetical protein